MTIITVTIDTEKQRVVPVEATDEMCEAAWDSDAADYVGEHKRIHSAGDAYRAMLSAAPACPQADEVTLGIFCPQCFADEGSGSWNHAVIRAENGGHCTNCGNGSCVALPKWAIDSIRQQASWVGKRHYPHDEDRERYIERQALLSLVVAFPGRSAKRLKDDPDPPSWNVSQMMPDGRQVQTIVRAPDAETAMRWSGLTYYAPIDTAIRAGGGDV